jgi:hypothetical protein
MTRLRDLKLRCCIAASELGTTLSQRMQLLAGADLTHGLGSVAGTARCFLHPTTRGTTLRITNRLPLKVFEQLATGAHSMPGVRNDRAPAVGAVAQLGERLVRNKEVSGSIPLGSTNRMHIIFSGWGDYRPAARQPIALNTTATTNAIPLAHSGTS